MTVNGLQTQYWYGNSLNSIFLVCDAVVHYTDPNPLLILRCAKVTIAMGMSKLRWNG